MMGRRGPSDDGYRDEFDLPRPRRRRRRLIANPLVPLGVGMVVVSAGWVLMASYLGMWEEGAGLSDEFDKMVVDGDGFAKEVFRKLTLSVAWYTGVFWLGVVLAVSGFLRWFWLLYRLIFLRR